jgi:hypothetical protein
MARRRDEPPKFELPNSENYWLPNSVTSLPFDYAWPNQYADDNSTLEGDHSHENPLWSGDTSRDPIPFPREFVHMGSFNPAELMIGFKHPPIYGETTYQPFLCSEHLQEWSTMDFNLDMSPEFRTLTPTTFIPAYAFQQRPGHISCFSAN